MEESTKQIKSLIFMIELHPDGQMSINCPMLGDTIFCLGLLEMAKAIVFQFKANQAKIVKPQGSIMDFVRRKFNA